MAKTHQRICDLQVGDRITQDLYLATDISLGKTRQGKDYLSLMLHDVTGSVEAKLWDLDLARWEGDALGRSEVLSVDFSVESYNGKLQARLERYQKIENPRPEQLRYLVPTAPVQADEVYKGLLDKVAAFKDPGLKKLIHFLWEKHKEAILISPASQKVHHAQRSGFLYHINRMVKSAEKLSEVYLNLDRELLISGCMLHDIGKLYEYESDQFGLVESYSRTGHLLGHITVGAQLVMTTCDDLGINEETKLLVAHMILAHHNEPEWGSPVRPAIAEALALHHIDALDAHMTVFEDTLANQEPGTFSSPQFFLNKTRLYKREGDDQ